MVLLKYYKWLIFPFVYVNFSVPVIDYDAYSLYSYGHRLTCIYKLNDDICFFVNLQHCISVPVFEKVSYIQAEKNAWRKKV